MTCKYCNSGNCYKHEDETEYQEFIPNKEYPIGGFFKIGNEVFKIVADTVGECGCCEFTSTEYDYFCVNGVCHKGDRKDFQGVLLILYDTLE